MSNNDCESVSSACPVEATVYGYYPTFGANTALLVFFSICLAVQVIACYLTRVYSYSIVVAVGCLVELLGYSGRLMMHANPWTTTGFQMQICCLIIGPSFLAAGIYLTLKHVIRHNGPQYSRLRPSLYTWIFIGCDIGSIILQAAGGGVAGAAGSSNTTMLDAGNNIMIAGIAFQVATMAICGLLAVDYIVKRWRCRRKEQHSSLSHAHGTDLKARLFQLAVIFAYLTVLVRCIYRLPEMAGGWGNPRMRDEAEFLVLDGLMVVLAAIALTFFHPGYFYPSMRTGGPRGSPGNTPMMGAESIRLDTPTPKNQ